MAATRPAGYGPVGGEAKERGGVDLYWAIGAMIGSALFILAGGPPARLLAAAVRRQASSGRRGR